MRSAGAGSGAEATSQASQGRSSSSQGANIAAESGGAPRVGSGWQVLRSAQICTLRMTQLRPYSLHAGRLW